MGAPKIRLLAAVLAAAALALPASAQATDPATLFNAPGQGHANVCARPALPAVALRFAGAEETGFSVTDQQTFYDGSCPDGTVRLDLHELVPSSGGPLAFHRGGVGYDDRANVKYGQLYTSELADPLPPPRPWGGGRGAPCTLAPGNAYKADVESIPEDMHYKRPQDVPSGSNNGTSFEHYGDPGADQGDRHDIHYSYLLWSFVNVRGGGMVRTLLAPDQPVRLCDVESVKMDAWDGAGVKNGEVTARYVRIMAGSCPLYGWMVWSHDYLGDPAGPVAHATSVTGTPPADPTPDASCPVAEPAAPPAVTTGDAATGTDGSATLAGSVDPKGVPTDYHFDFGTGPEYGTSTSPVSLSAAPRVVPVSAQVTGLAPGTTYHYRVVGSSTHGVSYGPDRTFTAPVPPPPPAPVEQPKIEAVVEPVVLSGLRVAPSAFARKRSWRGDATRIRFELSRPASVKLTFLRRSTGMLVRGSCRAAPRAGVPRGKKKCVRWVSVRGAITKALPAGENAVGFGGWVAKRPLAAGRYRVQAVATGGDGGPGRAQLASFTLRSPR